jgi:hypothetical protein
MAGYFANGNCYPCPRTNLLPISPTGQLRTVWLIALQRELCQEGEHVAAYVGPKTDKDLASFTAFSLNDDAVNQIPTFGILPLSRSRQRHRMWSTAKVLVILHVKHRAPLLDVGLFCHSTSDVWDFPPVGRVQWPPDVVGHES